MKKIITVTTILLVSLLFLTYNLYNKENISNTKININNNMLSIMLETEANSGTYNESTQNLFPSGGYVFNNELSGCENGSKLSWDEESKQVIMTGNTTDKCYVYFDIYVEPATFANYIKNLYTGTQGENGLYFHDSSLTNGAGDNSYRYAGANPNNYVCFGSDESTCPDDNLYRIIGVFDGKTKLIKADYASINLLGTDGDYSQTGTIATSSGYVGSLTTLDTYYWNYKNNTSVNSGKGLNTWSTSLLNKINLNTNYLNNIGSKWANMIAVSTWQVGGNNGSNIYDAISSVAYQNEIVNPASDTTYEAKIGLMYATDWGFAINQNRWNRTLNNYGFSGIENENWLYLGLHEFLVTRNIDNSYFVFCILNTGQTFNFNASVATAIRPTFYLNSSINYSSGDGTKTNPIRISSE